MKWNLVHRQSHMTLHSYRDAVSYSVGARFGVTKALSVGGGVYYTEEIFEEQSISHWSYFYSMDLQCVVSDASITSWSNCGSIGWIICWCYCWSIGGCI